eukprot:3666788-Karenia_brevis.AAC.1
MDLKKAFIILKSSSSELLLRKPKSGFSESGRLLSSALCSTSLGSTSPSESTVSLGSLAPLPC